MEVRLRHVREDELPEWLAESKRGYVEGMTEHGGYSPAAAERKADADWRSLVGQDGRPLDGHALYVVEDAEGAPVGRAWLGESEGPAGRQAVVYDVFVEPALRGRGLGRTTMELLEAEARRRGHRRIRLNVFGGNRVARELYGSLGYDEVAVYMGKDL